MEYVICGLVVLVIGLAAWYLIEELCLLAKPIDKVEHIGKNHKLTDEERAEINKAYYKQIDELRKEIAKNERKAGGN